MCWWGRGIKLPNPSQILRNVSDLLKILSQKFPISFPTHIFHYKRKDKNRLLNCFEGNDETFTKYHYVSQWRSTHVVVIVFPVRFIKVDDNMKGYQKVNKQNHKLKSTTAASTKSPRRIKFMLLTPSRTARFTSWHAIDFLPLLP